MSKRNNIILLFILFASTSFAQNLTIEECKRLALENNNQLKNARLEISASKETEKEAFTNYFPTVSGAAMGVAANTGMAKMNMEIPVLGDLPVSMFKHGKTAAITAVQPVFAGGQIVNGNKLATIGTDVANLQMQISENDVILNTEAYFWQIVSMKEKLITIEMLDKQLSQIHKDVIIAIEAGVAMPNDLLRVELQKQELASSKLSLENGISVMTLMLAQYIGLPDSTINVAYQNFTTPINPDAVYCPPAAASQERNEYKLMQKVVDSGKLKTKLELGKNLPSVGIGAGYVYHDFTGINNNFGMVFASVSVPISGWWGGSHAIKREKLKTKQAMIEKDNGRQLLEVQITKTWNDLNEAYKQIALAETSIKSAQENMRLNTDYFNVGLSTMTDVLDAQTLLQQSHNRLTDAYTNYQLKMTKYLIDTNQN